LPHRDSDAARASSDRARTSCLCTGCNGSGRVGLPLFVRGERGGSAARTLAPSRMQASSAWGTPASLHSLTASVRTPQEAEVPRTAARSGQHVLFGHSETPDDLHAIQLSCRKGPAGHSRRTFPDVTGTPAQMSKQESRSTPTRRPLGTRDATVLLGSRLACASDAKQSRWFTAAVGRVDRRPRGGRGARAARPTAVGDALSRTPRGRVAPRASPAAVVGAASRGRGSRFAART
jgi:hypothetical protein